MLRSLINDAIKFWYITLFTLLCLFCYVSVLIPPHLFWPAVFTSYAIPLVIMLNVVLLILLPLFKRRLALFPLVTLAMGLPFMLITTSYKSESYKSNYDLSILSFNTKFFRKSGTYDAFSIPMIKWVAQDTSDVKCIQEYSTDDQPSEINVSKQLKDCGYHSFEFRSANEEFEHNPGMAIFSIYNILDSGVVWQSEFSNNAILFADIKKGTDTVRIYNVHLESMGLQIHQYRNPRHYESKLRWLVSRLKWGAAQRARQIDMLIAHSHKSPYPYIICGDFNDAPYSYNYFKLKRFYLNAFEEAGNGFGFTFNSLLFFLRIDHHFYNEPIESISFRVDRSMKISDHFPTRGLYQIKRN